MSVSEQLLPQQHFKPMMSNYKSLYIFDTLWKGMMTSYKMLAIKNDTICILHECIQNQTMLVLDIDAFPDPPERRCCVFLTPGLRRRH